jgi:photosystem II stability/assembly factor-like uncharacterized protein
VSFDRGDSWTRAANQPGSLHLDDIVLSPAYASDRTVLVSDESGAIFLSSDGAESWRTIREPGSGVVDIAMLAGDSQVHIFALIDTGEVRRTTVGDEKWIIVEVPDGEKPYMLQAIGSSEAGGSLFVATDRGLYTSDDLGRTFESFRLPEGGLKRGPGKAISVDVLPVPGDLPSMILASWYGGAYTYDKSQGAWQAHTQGLTTNIQADEYGRPHFRELAVRGDTIFLSAFDGLFRSDDKGSTWYQMETLSARSPTSLEVMSAANGSDRLFVTTYDAGVYMSEDSGQTWSSLNYGLRNTHVWSIVSQYVGKNDDFVVLAAANQSIYSRSGSDGAWSEYILGCKGELASRSDLEIAWDDIKAWFIKPERCRATFPHQLKISSHADLNDRYVYFGTRYEGIFRSMFVGNSWEKVHDGLGSWVSRIELSPNQPVDHTVFATIRGKGVIRSVDDGATWRQVANSEILAASAGSPMTPLPLAISPEYSEDGRVYVGTPVGLFVSGDHGNSWRMLEVQQGSGLGESIRAIGISPDFSQDGYLLVSVRGHGLFASEDFGESFVPVAQQLITENEVLVSIHFPGRVAASASPIYALSEETLFVSRDKGKSWNSIRRPARYESASDALRLGGNWQTVRSEVLSELTAIQSDEQGASIELVFQGTEFSVIGYGSSESGIANVYVDDSPLGSVDFYTSSGEGAPVIKTFSELEMGTHIIRLEVSGKKSAQSDGIAVTLDAIDVF